MAAPFIVLMSVVSAAIPIVAGFAVFRRIQLPLWLLLAYLVISLMVEISLTFLFVADMNRSGLLHIYTLVEFIILASIFSLWQSGKFIKTALFVSVPVFVLFWVLAKTFIEDVDKFDSYSSSLAAFLLIIMALFTLYDMMKTSSDTVVKDPRLWFSAAVLCYFSGNLINFALFNSIFVWRLHMALNIIHNLLFTGVFLCQQPQQN